MRVGSRPTAAAWELACSSVGSGYEDQHKWTATVEAALRFRPHLSSSPDIGPGWRLRGGREREGLYMLRSYRRENSHLVLAQEGIPAEATGPIDLPVWIDLYNPAPQDNRYVEQLLGISLPTREEMQEIEVSARLYQEDAAEFMTLTAASQLESDEPINTPITFVLKGNTLVTVRYAEPKAFANFVVRAQRSNAVPVANGEQIMMGLIEALLDRMADALERVGTGIDQVSRQVFRRGGKGKEKASPSSEDLQAVIERIGQDGDLLTKVRESLVSINRVLTYHTSVDQQDKKVTKEAKARSKVLYRDVVALTDQATFLSSKVNFLLDATLGLINLQQNQIIKIFSVAAVVFLPPTLVASIYGMNFADIPELRWGLGYPFALGMMVVSAILPYLYFKRRRWL